MWFSYFKKANYICQPSNITYMEELCIELEQDPKMCLC